MTREDITALREAPAEQPAQQVVDSDEKAGAYMEARLWEFIDMAAAWPKASPDPRTWDHVVVYAPKPAQQEPVAIVHRNEYNEYRLEPHDNFDIKSIPFNIDVPLFKSPQRTWVGLTDEEIDDIYQGAGKNDLKRARAIEAKLKEKNT